MVSAFGPTDQVLKDLAQFKAQQESQAAARAKAQADARAQASSNITTINQVRDVDAGADKNTPSQ
jgi:hypothetical protein